MKAAKSISAFILCVFMILSPVMSLAAEDGNNETGKTEAVETVSAEKDAQENETVPEKTEEAKTDPANAGETAAEDKKEETAAEAKQETRADAQQGFSVKVVLDGKYMQIKSEPQIVNGTTYLSMHEFCVCLGCTDVWENGGVTLRHGKDLSIRCDYGKPYLIANGRALYMENGSLLKANGLWVPVRVLAKIFNMDVAWDGVTRTIYLTSKGGFIESGETFYDKEDLYWLSHIINAESRGEPLAGMIAVGNVILNRLNNPNFPDTIHGVIYDFSAGVQFAPAVDGSMELEPTEQTILAAKLCLDGAVVCKNGYYFMGTYVESCWASRNRPLVMTVGKHNFFG